MVVVLRLDHESEQRELTLSSWREIMMLSRYNHENLISLVGYCDEDCEKILVYKYASKGSLDTQLSTTNQTWIQRIKICLDVARGLIYLCDHLGTQLRVIHRDIKSTNFLSNENWNTKFLDIRVLGFGPTNHHDTLVIINVVSNLGYLVLLYLETYLLTKQSDVYSFGKFLFEVLCGRLDRGSRGSLKLFLDIVYRCLQKSREERPIASHLIGKYTMFDVLEEFQHLKIPPEEIKYVTHNFDKIEVIGSAEFKDVYIGEMSHSSEAKHDCFQTSRL